MIERLVDRIVLGAFAFFFGIAVKVLKRLRRN